MPPALSSSFARDPPRTFSPRAPLAMFRLRTQYFLYSCSVVVNPKSIPTGSSQLNSFRAPPLMAARRDVENREEGRLLGEYGTTLTHSLTRGRGAMDRWTQPPSTPPRDPTQSSRLTKRRGGGGVRGGGVRPVCAIGYRVLAPPALPLVRRRFRRPQDDVKLSDRSRKQTGRFSSPSGWDNIPIYVNVPPHKIPAHDWIVPPTFRTTRDTANSWYLHMSRYVATCNAITTASYFSLNCEFFLRSLRK